MSAAGRARSTSPHRFLATVIALGVSACTLGTVTGITPPRLAPPAPEALETEGATTRVGPAYLTRRGELLVMHVEGAPIELGYRHARLATPQMAEGDGRMIDLFATYVPSSTLRWLLSGLVRLRYRNLDDGFPERRRAEIFGQARGYADPFADFIPTYPRLVYLHGLYDIALSLERSPLLGCTAFVASGPATSGGATPGHTIVGRNFDLDVDPWFDERKLVQIVEPEAGLAFASVAWPGMTGAVTGMNEAGIWVSVNGARAGETRSGGVPVVFTTRAVLESARSLDDALRIVERHEPMVSHILLLADGKTGESMIVERAPGLPPGVVRHPSSTVLSNHFRTSPLRDDPKDAWIRDTSSTEAREARMTELVAKHRGRIDPEVAIAILRDRSGVGGVPLPIGNRRALDAMVATHSVVADLTARVLWVSEGPHTLGHYRAIDLGARLAAGEAAAGREASADVPADAWLADGTYERVRRGQELTEAADGHAAAGRFDQAIDLYHRAIALRADDAVAWRGLALAESRRGRDREARAAWARVLALSPDTPERLREAEAHARAS